MHVRVPADTIPTPHKGWGCEGWAASMAGLFAAPDLAASGTFYGVMVLILLGKCAVA